MGTGEDKGYRICCLSSAGDQGKVLIPEGAGHISHWDTTPRDGQAGIFGVSAQAGSSLWSLPAEDTPGFFLLDPSGFFIFHQSRPV